MFIRHKYTAIDGQREEASYNWESIMDTLEALRQKDYVRKVKDGRM